MALRHEVQERGTTTGTHLQADVGVTQDGQNLVDDVGTQWRVNIVCYHEVL